jgi:hypothetical protein
MLALLLVSSLGCGGPAPHGDGGQDLSSTGAPELTDDVIRQRINNVYVRDVKEENGAGEPIGWSFSESEPKEITILEKQIEGTHANVVLDIKTGTGPRSRNPRLLSGKIKTEWALESGWALRQWKIFRTENISMTYKNVPKTADQNTNR